MKFLLASSNGDVIAALIIFGVGLMGALITYILLKKHNFGGGKVSTPSKMEVELKKEYVSAEEMKLVEFIHKALPKEFIAFPRVGVDQVVNPTKNRIAYNLVMSKYLDVCIFYRKTMEPVLVIDIVWNNEAKQQFAEMDPNVIGVLKTVKLKVVKIKSAIIITVGPHSVMNRLPYLPA